MSESENTTKPIMKVMVEIEGKLVYQYGNKGIWRNEKLEDMVRAKYWLERSASEVDGWLKLETDAH